MASRRRTPAALLGSRGGRAGKGASKRRGDSTYYRSLAARRKDRAKLTTGVRHRHLSHQDFTLAAIDDVIANGRLDDWHRLRSALLRDPAIRAKILRVCAAGGQDPSAQRHRFWGRYAEEAGRAS